MGEMFLAQGHKGAFDRVQTHYTDLLGVRRSTLPLSFVLYLFIWTAAMSLEIVEG